MQLLFWRNKQGEAQRALGDPLVLSQAEHQLLAESLLLCYQFVPLSPDEGAALALIAARLAVALKEDVRYNSEQTKARALPFIQGQQRPR